MVRCLAGLPNGLATILAAGVAVLVLTPAAPTQPPPADLKGYALQQWMMKQYLNKGGTVPPRPAATAPPVYPTRSTIHMAILPSRPDEAVNVAVFGPAKVTAPADVASVMAHLPPGADMWIQDVPVVSDETRPVSEITFPTLEKGATYTFTVRVRWVEDGKWVTQSHAFPIRAGEIHCVKIAPNNTPDVDKAVGDNFAKLDLADRAAAAGQKFCAVQDTVRLGSMGPPVKVSVKGKDVYLCCEGCRAAALKDPEKTAKTAELNRDKK